MFGFFQEEERQLFLQLISVSGIGAGTAQLVLSALNPDQIKTAILQEDDRTFGKVKGIGPKTAKRIIIDLKDKISKEPINLSGNLPSGNNTIRDEALSALLALGFLRPVANQTLQKIFQEEPELNSVELVIKKALGRLS
ncbi:MAG: Holliday junction branch migration protein RuvA [Saprospiraceae bacterium]|nr:Holliday junction branch migration protein RuvA [Saprospiraceae bacterium]